MRPMFRAADPSRRLPVWLQNGTKENVIWQIKLAGVYLVFVWIKAWWDDRQEYRRLHSPDIS